MSPRCLARHLLVAAALGAGASLAGAQSMPAMTTAKNAARRAAAATNEHIRREQDVDGATAAPRRARKPVAVTRVADVSAHAAHAAHAAQPAHPARAARTTPTPGGALARPTAAGPTKHPAKKPAVAGSSDVSEHTGANEISLMRETFTYHADGRRDPFVSLITSGQLRPMLSDLRLVTVIYDPHGRSVAVMRDVSTKEQYRVKVGQTLGRMRVARIRPQSVVFTIEEFGFSRQESLALNDTTRARSQ